jgi:predicted ABC-class ATPase
MHSLRSKLNRINNNGYKIYKSLYGQYNFGNFTLSIDQIQADPFASPSKITVSIPLQTTGIPQNLINTPIRKKAFVDALSRVIAKSIRKVTKGNRGTGNSGVFAINYGTQKILLRNSVITNGKDLQVRLLVGLPAYGRKIDAIQAEEMFFEELPEMVNQTLFWKNLDHKYFHSFVNLIEKQEYIRAMLPELGLVCFIADNSILARRSGIDDTPLDSAVKFVSPESMRIKIEFPDKSNISGMGIPNGVTLITGGGFHGKSTLLNAIQEGIYNHIPGDGREYVVSQRHLAKIRAEDGRNVASSDISIFINNLPGGINTSTFSTENASGSTSQASNIVEAIEAGAEVLLMDEDTSATNFLIRDKRMQELIPSGKEPITPYIDTARALFENHGVSTILVVGGSGDYIDIADKVILMDNYKAEDATARAKDIARKYPYTHINEFNREIRIRRRIPLRDSIDPSKGKREAKISSCDTGIIFGKQRIELSGWEHIIDKTQYSTIGDLIYYALKTNLIDNKNCIDDIIKLLVKDMESEGLDIIWQKVSRQWNYYCEVRELDIAATINRLRMLKARSKEG